MLPLTSELRAAFDVLVVLPLLEHELGPEAVSPLAQGTQAVKPVETATKLFFQSHAGHPSEESKTAAEEAVPKAQDWQFELSV